MCITSSRCSYIFLVLICSFITSTPEPHIVNFCCTLYSTPTDSMAMVATWLYQLPQASFRSDLEIKASVSSRKTMKPVTFSSAQQLLGYITVQLVGTCLVSLPTCVTDAPAAADVCRLWKQLHMYVAQRGNIRWGLSALGIFCLSPF